MNRPKNTPVFVLLTVLTLLAGGAASYALLAWSEELAAEPVAPAGEAG